MSISFVIATMRKLLFLVFASTLFPTTAVRAQQLHDPNEDFRSIAPASWKLLPPDPVRHERRFVSPAGDAWLALYARPADRVSTSAYIEAVKSAAGERITYQRQGRGWVVVSGYRGDRIFYRKAMLACGNRKWHNLEFEYPAAEKRAFDRFVTRASFALQAYARVGCDDKP